MNAIRLNQEAAFHAGIRVMIPNAASSVERARVLMRRGRTGDRRKLLAIADAEVLDRD